jgi:hypothetical protein
MLFTIFSKNYVVSDIIRHVRRAVPLLYRPFRKGSLVHVSIYIVLLAWLISHQPTVLFTFLSEQTSHRQPANSTFLSEQISTSHQPPAKRTGYL